MMALFKDVNVDKIVFVGSARTHYLDCAYENDTIYAYAGGEQYSLNRMASEGINDVDIEGQYVFRNTSLNRAWEHKLFVLTNSFNTRVFNMVFRTTTDNHSLLKYCADEIGLSAYDGNVIVINICTL